MRSGVASVPSSFTAGSPGITWNARNARKETMTMVSSISPIFLAAYFMVIASFSSMDVLYQNLLKA